MAEKPINTVEDILASTIKNGFDGSIQTAGRFIFGDSDSTLPYSQKRAFLTAVEGMHYRDNHGQDHVRPTFTLIETGVEPVIAEGVRSELSDLCEVGLLNLISENPYRYAFTKVGFVFIGNYFTLREFHEGGGRAKLPPDLGYKTVILPSIPTSPKSFVQLLKSIQRRIYEGQTGNLLQFQDKDRHDYESITRVSFTFQAPNFFIEPALSFEIIPLEPARVKVIAECYHGLAEEAFNVFLTEVIETWPEGKANSQSRPSGGGYWPDGPTGNMARQSQEADMTLSTLEHKWPDLPADMLQERLKVWELWDKQRLKLRQITSQVNFSESTTKRHLDALETAGLLRRKRKKMNAR